MKKIAIIENGWGKFINYAWTLGIKQYLDEHGINANIYIFNSFGNLGMDEKFNVGEYNITKLPSLERFDGIFLELTNFSDPEVKKDIIERVKASKVPAVSLVEEIPGLYYAGIDNYSAMEKMVEHFVEQHHCSRINYVGGPVSSSENMARFQAYKDVLENTKFRSKRSGCTITTMKSLQGKWRLNVFIPEDFCRRHLSAQTIISQSVSAIRQIKWGLKFRMIFW